MLKKRIHIFKILTILSIATLCYFPQTMAQQKVQFSQYMFNNLVINPAYAGAEGPLSLTLVNRSQWSGIENAPKTQTFSAHTLFKKKNIGLGLTMVNDKIGVHKNLSILTNYAYHIQTAENSFLSLGLQAGFNNMRSDYASLSGGAMIDPKLYNVNISENFFEAGVGIYFRSPKWDIGLSAPELIPDRILLNDTLSVKLNRANFFLFSKYQITCSDNLEFEPSVMVKYLPGLPFSFDTNINMIYREVLTLGVSYRKSESVDFLFKGQVTNQLELGYVYDYNIGEISKFSNGSHELMVHYHFRYAKTNVASPR